MNNSCHWAPGIQTSVQISYSRTQWVILSCNLWPTSLIWGPCPSSTFELDNPLRQKRSSEKVVTNTKDWNSVGVLYLRCSGMGRKQRKVNSQIQKTRLLENYKKAFEEERYWAPSSDKRWQAHPRNQRLRSSGQARLQGFQILIRGP